MVVQSGGECVPVLIMGAGPVGLSMALALARQGIPSMLVERHPSTTDHPKARGVNTRTMEIFRGWGLESALSQHQLPVEAHRFIWMESLQGAEITRIAAKPRAQSVSPTHAALISQDWVEAELLEAVRRYPEVECRFHTMAEAVEVHEHGVWVTLRDRDTGSTTRIRADWLVAADGASSPTRQALSVGMTGEENLGEFCNIYCEMDLSRYVADRPAVGYIFTREDVRGTFLLAKDGMKRWLVGVRYDVLEGISQDTFTDVWCEAFIRRLVGDPAVEIRLINKAFWTMAALVADTWRVGRVFFAGDSAHRLPPTGGLGMNSGVQDAHNLAWKLAAVIRGEAQDSLLDTYQKERQPVVEANIAWSMKNASRFNTIFSALAAGDFAAMTSALEEQSDHLNQLRLDLGFRYAEGVLFPEPDADLSSAESGIDYIPSTAPGCRAPHYPLVRQGTGISTLDLFETHFVLLSTDASMIWHDACANLGIPGLVSYRIGPHGELQDPDGAWCKQYAISPLGAVLVRPDGHVAWRSVNGSATAAEDLAAVSGRWSH